MIGLRQKIWGEVDPYKDTDPNLIDIQGWRQNHPVLNEAAMDASLIAEIGVWKGASAIDMAKANPYAEILAIDTFRGSYEHWVRRQWQKDVRGDLYQTFLNNVASQGLQSRITPLPLDSVNAASVAMHHELKFDLVHIDGAHDYLSVYADLALWSPLARVIVVDDYQGGWPEVDQAVDQFVSKGKWWVKWCEDGKARLEPIEEKNIEPPDAEALAEGADAPD